VRFSDEEIRRYSRQIVLPEVGGAGQEKLRAATVTAASDVEALYLAAAGVGAIVVPSEEIAAATRALNPLVRVEVGIIPERIHRDGLFLCRGQEDGATDGT